mmetsp:Transcript_29646/g.74387  ORF Transcript_29646/g.74387 Transcript_29646/m.74387 type:complete len:208 (+) Transcript_29646:866-1489(+)
MVNTMPTKLAVSKHTPSELGPTNLSCAIVLRMCIFPCAMRNITCPASTNAAMVRRIHLGGFHAITSRNRKPAGPFSSVSSSVCVVSSRFVTSSLLALLLAVATPSLPAEGAVASGGGRRTNCAGSRCGRHPDDAKARRTEAASCGRRGGHPGVVVVRAAADATTWRPLPHLLVGGAGIDDGVSRRAACVVSIGAAAISPEGPPLLPG